jgi:hypothetical protein
LTGSAPGALIIACGALAQEIAALRRINRWDALDIQCLPPELHNYPKQIPARVREAIHAARGRYSRIFVAYADCGTGGSLDAVLAEEGVERLPGAHCYEFFATAQRFSALAEQEPGTFYLTDFRVRHVDRLVAQTLGIDRHPELIQEYFRNYRRVVYLIQDPAQSDVKKAAQIAEQLGLEYESLVTGYGDLEPGLRRAAASPVESPIKWATWPR